MTKNAYKITGDFQMGRVRQTFAVEMVGSDEDDARDHLYKDIGSRHGVPRRLIHIETVEAIDSSSAGEITQKRLSK